MVAVFRKVQNGTHRDQSLVLTGSSVFSQAQHVEHTSNNDWAELVSKIMPTTPADSTKQWNVH
ncbi:hypothetical protein SAMN05428970_1326 [Agromyces sp. CF514]|nr:hypothetical protein SAMN05428970_1326 [Agromyces sp. CF514]